MKTLKRIWTYMKFMEEHRMKAAIWTGSAGPLM